MISVPNHDSNMNWSDTVFKLLIANPTKTLQIIMQDTQPNISCL